MVASFAFDFVDAFPGRFFLVGRFRAREIYFYFETIERAAEDDAAREA